jgi:hypothetical protein
MTSRRPDSKYRLKFRYPSFTNPSGLTSVIGWIWLVEDLVIVEIKALEEIVTVHKAQLLSYLRMSKKTLGLLINFNVLHLKEGIHRVVNGGDWRKPL